MPQCSDIPGSKAAEIGSYFAACDYRLDEIVSVCWKHKTKSGKVTLAYEHLPVRDAVEEVPRHEDRDSYISAGTFATIPKSGRGEKQYIARIPALYADLDYKHFGKTPADEDRDEKLTKVIARVSEILGVQPCAIVATGGGAHPRWKLDGDLDEETLERFGELVVAVAKEFGGNADPMVYERARLLRAPGSVNHRGYMETGEYEYGDKIATTVQVWPERPAIAVDRLRQILDEHGIEPKKATKRKRSGQDGAQRPQRPTVTMTASRGNSYVNKAVEHIVEELKASTSWPEGYRDERGRGWEKFQADQAYRLAGLALADWNDLTLADAKKTFLAEAPTGGGWTYQDVDDKWTWQSGYASPADPPKDDPAFGREPDDGTRVIPEPNSKTEIPAMAATMRETAPEKDDTAPENDGTAPGAPCETDRYTEDGDAQALIASYGDVIRFCPERERWLVWNGHVWRWQPPGGGQVCEHAKSLARGLPTAPKAAEAHRRRALSAHGVSGALRQAQTDPRVVVHQWELDAHPWELNTPGGTVDLRTGELMLPDSTHLHTQITACTPDPAADRSAWTNFLADTFGEDDELKGYLKRLVGYSAVGEVGPHVLPFGHGPGGNGKGVFMETCTGVLGDYAAAAPRGFLMAGPMRHETEIARLAGKRLVVCSEINERDRFDEAKVKLLTGGDVLTGRFMRADFFDFKPTHQLWLIGNHRPTVEAGGEGFWRRVREIGFLRTVPEDKRIDGLQQILAGEHGPAVLAWIVEGAAEFCRLGLVEPESVKRATNEYAREQDTVSQFLDERVHQGVDSGGLGRVWRIKVARSTARRG